MNNQQIYLTDFERNDITAQYYGTRINISDLIHELGHAWAAQKDEYIQEENGNYVFQVGTARKYYIVDKKTHTTKDDKTEGLFVEEAMNSIEQEAALYRLFGIKDYKSIPGYVPTVYQLGMAELMRHCIEKLGETTFEKIRIIKDRGEI